MYAVSITTNVVVVWHAILCVNSDLYISRLRSCPLPNYDPINAIHYQTGHIINIVSGDLIEWQSGRQ